MHDREYIQPFSTEAFAMKFNFDSAFNIIELNWTQRYSQWTRRSDPDIHPAFPVIRWTPSGFTTSPQICSLSLFILCHHISVNIANLHFFYEYCTAVWREFRLDWELHGSLSSCTTVSSAAQISLVELLIFTFKLHSLYRFAYLCNMWEWKPGSGADWSQNAVLAFHAQNQLEISYSNRPL